MKNFNDEWALIRQICESERFKRHVDEIKHLFSGGPLVLYGAGTIGHSTARLFRRYDIEVSCFCDKNKGGKRDKSGLPVLFPEHMADRYPDANIIVCSVNCRDEITRDLQRLGIAQEHIWFRDALNLHEMTCEDMLPYLEGYQRTFDLLWDDLSRQILLERIRCYVTSMPITSSGPENQYFDPEIITLGKREIFVDGGMYTGDTAQAFFQMTGGQYAHYYGFEPDKRNYLAAVENLRGWAELTLVQKGLWSCETRFGFSGELSSSSRLEEGGDLVEVTALDAFFQNREGPTFIKMDVEGAELEALKGAENLIRSTKPKLAICAYHRPEDLFTLPELIKRVRKDYRFYLRHYTDTIYETVLYAV